MACTGFTEPPVCWQHHGTKERGDAQPPALLPRALLSRTKALYVQASNGTKYTEDILGNNCHSRKYFIAKDILQE